MCNYTIIQLEVHLKFVIYLCVTHGTQMRVLWCNYTILQLEIQLCLNIQMYNLVVIKYTIFIAFLSKCVNIQLGIQLYLNTQLEKK